MRIKWNRHLDGSSSRRSDEETGTPVETDGKKPTSSPSIFKIFRRKKHRGGGDENKVESRDNFAVPAAPPPLHSEVAVEDDCASISSVTTCASQSVTEGFHRDRAGSLFSSFRLSLPGSKRKKRKIAPTPSETLLNHQQPPTGDPQVERYSTPDLRKTSGTLDGAQVGLSTSSPSIRGSTNHRGASSSTSAQSLDIRDAESSLDKLKWSNRTTKSAGSSKLSKSVSFSDCKNDELADSSHSTCDNKAPWGVNCAAMVEEDPRALESESAACLSDNLLRLSRESRFTPVDDSLCSTANVSSLQKSPGLSSPETTVGVMTKPEEVVVAEQSSSIAGDILNGVTAELRCHGTGSDKARFLSASTEGSVLASANRYDCVSSYSNGYSDEAVSSSSVKNGSGKPNGPPSVQSLDETAVNNDASSLSEQNTHSTTCDESSVLCSSKYINAADLSPQHADNPNNVPLNTKLEVLTSELSILTDAKSLSELNCDSVAVDVLNDGKEYECEMSDNFPDQKRNAIASDKHVMCHIKVCEKSDDCESVGDITPKFETIEKSPNPVRDSVSQKNISLSLYETRPADGNIEIPTSPSKSSRDFSNHSDSLSKYDLLSREAKRASTSLPRSEVSSSDRKVPSASVLKNGVCHNDQQVPEFEMSLQEFEDVCNKYMSRSSPDFTDFNSSTIPLYRNSPKLKSVLDLNFSYVYPGLQESPTHNICGSSEAYFRKKRSASPSDPVRRNATVKLDSYRHPQSLCQNLIDGHLSLPSPPKQWNSNNDDRAKPTDIDSRQRDVCTEDRVQCTKVRGKYLCQKPCLEALPTTVMPDDSDLEGGIDTPQLSSTLPTFETESGRELSTVAGEKQDRLLPDVPPSLGMISVGISTLNGVLDYSRSNEPAGDKSSVLLDPEIRNTYLGPRAICDPCIYGSEITAKSLESLGSDSYLAGHNFSDIRTSGFCEVISTAASRDYVPTGNGLIEISNPYEEDSFMFPRDLTEQNSLPKGEKDVPANNIETSPARERSPKVAKFPGGASEISADKLNDHAKENKLTPLEHKNVKNKNSMIPCRKKGTPGTENQSNRKNIDAKPKSKKSNSLPKFTKAESHLPVKNNSSSHRLFSNSCKDSVAEHRGKRRDVDKKPNGICSPSITIAECESPATSELLPRSCSQRRGSLKDFNDPGRYGVERKSTSSLLEDFSPYSNGVIVESKNSCSFVVDLDDHPREQHGVGDSKSVLSSRTDSVLEIETPFSKKCVETSDNVSECAVSVSENGDVRIAEKVCCPECLQLDVRDNVDVYSENVRFQCCPKHLDYTQCSRRSSLSAYGMRKTSYTSSRESLSSQLTSSSYRDKSRIPRKQPGTRGAPPSTKGPVRPPTWLSKAELTQEIQRLGTLCEARTKELNRLKMETKHVSVGFDAFAALFKYMVEDLNGLSVPALTEDLGKTMKQLELAKQDLAYYEREVEEMKSHHCQELNDLSNKLFEVYQSEVAELNSKHQEEVGHIKNDHQQQIDHLTDTFDTSSNEAKAHHEKMIKSLEQEIINQREELQQIQEREIKDLEEKHAEGSKVLQDHIEQLQKKCADLKQHSMSMEDAMRKDTDSKLQWVTSAKVDLEKEVESLKAVLEMKNKELHTLRVQNLEMEKQLEELPFAREKIKMLQARAEDLEALMVEKTKLERKLSTENQQIRDTYEKESKVNRRLSMENEELQWRLRQAENSLISGSFSEVPEFPETEDSAITSPTKSPGPQMLSRSVFFTFVDKNESTPHSPRSQYKKITPNFSANYRTSPAKSSKSPPAQSPRRGKSHSEPPQPIISSTPRKVAKQPLCKAKCPQKRQRSGSDSAKPSEHAEVNFSSVTESMASSVSSESSVFEHRERLLDEHKEHIIKSLEILREQRSAESSVDDPTVIEKKWCSDDIKITSELPNLDTGDMSRSAEFSDPKTYYHMTFPVLKESGITDCEIEDGCKNSSSGNSPTKDINSMHSMSENDICNAVEASENLQIVSTSSQEVSTAVVRLENKRNSCTESTLASGNAQREDAGSDKTQNRWRTI